MVVAGGGSGSGAQVALHQAAQPLLAAQLHLQEGCRAACAGEQTKTRHLSKKGRKRSRGWPRGGEFDSPAKWQKSSVAASDSVVGAIAVGGSV